MMLHDVSITPGGEFLSPTVVIVWLVVDGCQTIGISPLLSSPSGLHPSKSRASKWVIYIIHLSHDWSFTLVYNLETKQVEKWGLDTQKLWTTFKLFIVKCLCSMMFATWQQHIMDWPLWSATKTRYVTDGNPLLLSMFTFCLGATSTLVTRDGQRSGWPVNTWSKVDIVSYIHSKGTGWFHRAQLLQQKGQQVCHFCWEGSVIHCLSVALFGLIIHWHQSWGYSHSGSCISCSATSH